MKESSLSFSTLLLLGFIILKLCGVIMWSWWWVLSPLWIPLAIAVFFFIAVAIWSNFSLWKIKRSWKKGLGKQK